MSTSEFQIEPPGRRIVRMRTFTVAAVGTAIIASAAPAHADNSPDYSAYLRAVAPGDGPQMQAEMQMIGDHICASLRSGMRPRAMEDALEQMQTTPPITEVQAVPLVRAAQDYICPDTK